MKFSHRIPQLIIGTLIVLIIASTALYVGGQGKGGKRINIKLDHFWCYIVSQQTPQSAITVTLQDQFQTQTVTVGEPLQFCNPAQKTVGDEVTSILDINNHLTMYNLLTSAPLPSPRTFTATNQFGSQQFTVDKATVLMLPTQKDALRFPTKLDHFWCYPITSASLNKAVSLSDQFQSQDVTVEKPELFCNPVAKTVGTNTTRIQNEAAHLTCYNIRLPQSTTSRQIPIKDQFESDTFTLTNTQLLCLPSTKTLVSP